MHKTSRGWCLAVRLRLRVQQRRDSAPQRTVRHTKAFLDAGSLRCVDRAYSRGLHSHEHVPAVRLPGRTVLRPRPVSFMAQACPGHQPQPQHYVQPTGVYCHLHQRRHILRSRADSPSAFRRVFGLARRHSGDSTGSFVGFVPPQSNCASLRLFRMTATPMRCSEQLRASRHLLPPPPFRPPCRCRAALRCR